MKKQNNSQTKLSNWKKFEVKKSAAKKTKGGTIIVQDWMDI